MLGRWWLYWDLVDPSRLGHYRRLARQVDGWLSRKEEAILFRLARAVPKPQCIVELGSWLGRSSIILGGGSRSGLGAPLYAVDYFQALGSQKELLEQRAGEEKARDYLPTFQSNIRWAGLSELVQPIRSGTAAAGQNWQGPAVGLLFIDADHSYAAVKTDWEAWRSHMTPGGFVAFHDYQNPAFEVTRFVDEQIASGILKKLSQHDMIVCCEVIPNGTSR